MPPRKNKKPSKNGFWQFVLECRDKNPNKNMEEAKAYATRKWATMTKEERKPYEDMALLVRNTYQTSRLTSDGLEIDEVERQQRETEEKIQLMKNDITNRFTAASLDEKLDEEVFILIHVNHLIYVQKEDKYYICEIALASVTLKNGIEDIFHRIVKPGALPLGFYGPALNHSKETHQLVDIVQDEPRVNNTEEVFSEMIAFMRRFGNHKLPILYADEKTLEMTKKVMENFCEEFNFREEIKVYNLQYMFSALKNAAAGENVWPTDTQSHNIIERDIYCYCPNVGCDFHEMADNCTYCSKAIVTRYAYTICDFCCGDLGIQLIPGFHVPLKARVAPESTKFSSKASSMTSIDQISNKGRMSSLSSRGYEENYPPLGSRSSVSSVVSFSSMKTKESSQGSALTTSNVAALEQSFQTASIRERKRDHKKFKFPQHGFERDQSQ